MPRPAAVLDAVIACQVAALAADNPTMPPDELAREQSGVRAEIVADWRSYASQRDAAAVFSAFLQRVA